MQLQVAAGRRLRTLPPAQQGSCSNIQTRDATNIYIYIYTQALRGLRPHRVSQKEFYNFESLCKFNQRTCAVF
jgi:hypothetical protein